MKWKKLGKGPLKYVIMIIAYLSIKQSKNVSVISVYLSLSQPISAYLRLSQPIWVESGCVWNPKGEFECGNKKIWKYQNIKVWKHETMEKLKNINMNVCKYESI